MSSPALPARQVAKGLGDVVVYPPPFLHRRGDRREVVVRNDDVGGLLGDFRPGDAHGDANRRLLQRRGIVHPISGHGDHGIAPLPGTHDPQLVGGGDSREHGNARYPLRQIAVVETGQLGAGESLVAPIQNTELTRDRPRSVRVVASDHHDPDSGSSAFGDRVARFGPRRVLQADQTE